MKLLLKSVLAALYIENIALAAVLFSIFLDYYDIGTTDFSGVLPTLAWGTILGSLTLIIERLFYQHRGFWPSSKLGFLARSTLFSVIAVSLSYPIIGLFFLPLLVPFGLVAGLVNALLLRATHVFHFGDAVTHG